MAIHLDHLMVPSRDNVAAAKLMAPGYRPRDEAGGGGAVASAVHRGGQPETDATRCALARAVIDGAVGHVNELPLDQHDRDVAANDIRAYCR